MNPDIAKKLRMLTLGKRQELLLRNPSLSGRKPDQQALEALDAALQPRPTGGGNEA